jgi:hypothetical protein
MHEQPTEVVTVLLDAVVLPFDFGAVEELQYAILQFAAAPAGNDLDQRDAFFVGRADGRERANAVSLLGWEVGMGRMVVQDEGPQHVLRNDGERSILLGNRREKPLPERKQHQLVWTPGSRSGSHD